MATRTQRSADQPGVARWFRSLYGQLEQPQDPHPQKNGKETQPVWHESTNTRFVRHAHVVIDDTPSQAHQEQVVHQLHPHGS